MVSQTVATILGILSFIPPFSGLLRFYLGDILLGLVYTFTAGLCWIGNILDIVNVPRLVHQKNLQGRYHAAQFSPEATPNLAAPLGGATSNSDFEERLQRIERRLKENVEPRLANLETLVTDKEFSKEKEFDKLV